MLHLHDVQKIYDKQDILTVPSLHLEKGIYWIKGANGSGKTTLLKIIGGLIPFGGDVIFNDKSIKKDPLEYRRCVSWAMADPVFPEFISGIDLISFYCAIRKVSSKEADELIDKFNMHGFVKAATGTYSSGMMKKLAIVLACLGKPPLILLDEPFITLDKESVAVMCNLIEDWHHDPGISFLLSSHIDEEDSFHIPYTELTVADHTIRFSS